MSGANSSGVGLIVDSSATIKQTLSIGYQVVQQTSNSTAACNVACPTGEVVLGGGCNDSITASNSIVQAFPTLSGTIPIFTCTFTLGTGNCTAYAICARLGP